MLPVILAEARVGVEPGRLGRGCACRSTGCRAAAPDRRRRAASHHASAPTARCRARALSSAGCAAASASTAVSAAAIQSAGSCSDHPGCGRETSSAPFAWPMMRWAPSISSALTPDVPRSSPRYMPGSSRSKLRSKPPGLASVQAPPPADYFEARKNSLPRRVHLSNSAKTRFLRNSFPSKRGVLEQLCSRLEQIERRPHYHSLHNL